MTKGLKGFADNYEYILSCPLKGSMVDSGTINLL